MRCFGRAARTAGRLGNAFTVAPLLGEPTSTPAIDRSMSTMDGQNTRLAPAIWAGAFVLNGAVVPGVAELGALRGCATAPNTGSRRPCVT